MQTMEVFAVQAKPTIQIAPDTEVRLQTPGGTRAALQLLGKVEGQYLVLRIIRPKSFDTLGFSYGDTVILRYLHAGVVYAFRTLVLNAVHAPEGLLFVAYPQAHAVQHHPLRASDRLPCSLPVNLTLGDTASAALVVDLSQSGCQCVLPPSADAGAEDSLENLVAQRVQLQLHGLGEGELTLAGAVRRHVIGERSQRLGVEFDEPQADFFSRVANLLRLAADDSY
jgi:hypothetical protein